MEPASHKPVVLVTAADLAPQALDMLTQFDVVFAGKQPTYKKGDLEWRVKQPDQYVRK